ncbi:MAG: ThuA domain-containing protein [Cytophagales bacterium]|nr:ThuA domain-containing protein [Cytophagales bacterium]
MKKVLKIVLISMLSLIIILAGLMWGFFYKVKNGFPVSYETDQPTLNIPAASTRSVLLFSKTTGFRHGESIEAGKAALQQMAVENNWFLHETEAGGVFNADQLPKFDIVIFNNVTGKVFNMEQRQAMQAYVEQGGVFLGIHGAGDFSHPWDWYVDELIGAEFSHHSLDPQFQEAEMRLAPTGHARLTRRLPKRWRHTEEWYVFYDSPAEKGAEILYSIDGTSIDPNGNMLWIKDKDFGMGKEHPVAWSRNVKGGQAYYTSLGHAGAVWSQEPFLQMLKNVIEQ